MKHLLALLVLALTSPAFAAESNGSEYQWQTPAGKWEVTPELSYMSQKVSFKPSGDNTTKGMREEVRGEYGISEMFSAGAKLAMSSLKTERPAPARAVTQSGLEDLILFFHGRMPMGGASFRFGADVNYALAKSENETNGDTNNASGGMGIAPFVGYEMAKDTCTMGARLSYKLWLGDRTEKNPPATVETKLSGSNVTTISLFYEHNMAPMTLGAALEFTSTDKEESSVSGVTTKTAGNTTSGLKLYVPYMINDMITILPSFTYNKFTAVDSALSGSAIDSANNWTLAVGGRFQF